MVSVRAIVPVGENVAEHVADATVPVNVHGEPVSVPVPLLVKATVLLGRVGVAEVSVTVAVQVVDAAKATLEGAQDTDVVVGFAGAATITLRTIWLGWALMIVAPLVSRAEPVAPALSTTRKVTS